jgi:hydrogenase-4 membrane subunit HyfE
VDEIRSSRRTLILVGIAILIIWAILIPLLLI